MHKWADENPDLVKAFLVAWDRTVRWLNSDNGAHWDEAAQIASREVREPKSVALYDLKDESRIVWSWGVTDYQDAVDSVKKFQSWNIANKDPFYTKHHLSDKEIEAFVDRRFFRGGEYFVDTSEHPENLATHVQSDPPADAKSGVQVAQAAIAK
jgi:sulfonate transport system substrate-binding protein